MYIYIYTRLFLGYFLWLCPSLLPKKKALRPGAWGVHHRGRKDVQVERGFGICHRKNRGRKSLKVITYPWDPCMVYFWANYNDLSRGHPKWWFSTGIPPNMALNQVRGHFGSSEKISTPHSVLFPFSTSFQVTMAQPAELDKDLGKRNIAIPASGTAMKTDDYKLAATNHLEGYLRAPLKADQNLTEPERLHIRGTLEDSTTFCFLPVALEIDPEDDVELEVVPTSMPMLKINVVLSLMAHVSTVFSAYFQRGRTGGMSSKLP